MNKNILWFVSFAWACVTFFSFLNQFGELHKFFSLISFYPNFDRKSYINSPARLTKAVWLKLPQLLKQFINFGRAFALSRYTSTKYLLWKVCRLSSWLAGSLWNHTSLVSKGKSPLILTPRLSLKRHSSSFENEKVSNSQQTGVGHLGQQTSYSGSMAGLWMGKGGGLGVLWSGCK